MGGGALVLLIALPAEIPVRSIEELQKKFPNLEVKTVAVPFSPTEAQIYEKIPHSLWKQVSILLTLRALPSKPKEDAPNLQLVHLASAGSNAIQQHPVYTDTDIVITTSNGVHGPQITEWVIMTALAHSHALRHLYDMQRDHRWKDYNTRGPQHSVKDMAGKRIGILGYGSIGRQVGRVAKALGMDVLAYTATPKHTAESKKDHGFIVPGTGDEDGEFPSQWYSGLDKPSLNDFLKQEIDWLVVAVPLTKQTFHFLGKTEFESLSHAGTRPAFISNIARGQIINQPELIEALKSGLLSGAALDVTDPEPLPEDSELWDLPNCTVTPHISGMTDMYFDRVLQVLELNLRRKDRGEKLLNVVERSRGY